MSSYRIVLVTAVAMLAGCASSKPTQTSSTTGATPVRQEVSRPSAVWSRPSEVWTGRCSICSEPLTTELPASAWGITCPKCGQHYEWQYTQWHTATFIAVGKNPAAEKEREGFEQCAGPTGGLWNMGTGHHDADRTFASTPKRVTSNIPCPCGCGECLTAAAKIREGRIREEKRDRCAFH